MSIYPGPLQERALISQRLEYALRATVQLARTFPAGQTTDALAASTRVPRAYLSKVLQGLARADLIHSRRGIGGGMGLSRAPEEVTILEVVNAVDPLGQIRTCPLGLVSHGHHLCRLRSQLDQALAMTEEAFAQGTLADLIAEPIRAPTCTFPHPRLKRRS